MQGILEALEFYIALGKQPERSFYVAFGHDEEVDKMISSINESCFFTDSCRIK